MVSIAVAGGRVAPPRAVPTVLRMGQLLLSPLQTASALAEARKARRALKDVGLESTRIATGDRSRSRYGLGRGGWLRRLRTPVGFVLTGSRGPRAPSLLDTAIDRAREAAGMPLERLSTTVFESGRVMVCLRAPDGESFFMRLAAGPSRRQLDVSLDALERDRRRERAAGGARPAGDPARRRARSDRCATRSSRTRWEPTRGA